MNREQVDIFEKLTAQLQSTHREMSALAKRSPHDAVNAFKLKLINATIDQCNELFGEAYRPFADFVTFVSDEMPSNSDVSFIVAQYLECAEKFRADHIIAVKYNRWVWDTEDLGEDDDGGENAIHTLPPKKLTKG
jgi:hypothetical protein